MNTNITVQTTCFVFVTVYDRLPNLKYIFSTKYKKVDKIYKYDEFKWVFEFNKVKKAKG